MKFPLAFLKLYYFRIKNYLPKHKTAISFTLDI
jgi:hypothetical protein